MCGRIGEIRMNGNNGLGGEVWGMDNRKGGEVLQLKIARSGESVV